MTDFDIETARTAIGLAFHEIEIVSTRSGKVLAGKHIEALQVQQQHLLKAHKAIEVALAHTATLLQNAGARSTPPVDKVHSTGADALRRQLSEVRAKRKMI